jgi:hypothetical protein
MNTRRGVPSFFIRFETGEKCECRFVVCVLLFVSSDLSLFLVWKDDFNFLNLTEKGNREIGSEERNK